MNFPKFYLFSISFASLYAKHASMFNNNADPATADDKVANQGQLCDLDGYVYMINWANSFVDMVTCSICLHFVQTLKVNRKKK